MNRRAFIKGTVAAATATVAGTSLYAFGSETHNLEKTTVRLPLGLSQPLRMVAIGDLHFDPLYEEAYIERVVASVAALQPDLIVYTGDFITHNTSRVHDLVALLSRATSRFGSFAILGNHDLWFGPMAVMTALEKGGIQVLRNRSIALPRQDHLFLTGFDSFWAGGSNFAVLSQTPRDSRHIVLLHEPDPFNMLTDPRIKLQISGHTHGGQVRVPLIGALHLPKWGKNFQEGLYTQNGRSLYVNRGIGTLLPHVRFDCRPEITLFELS